MYFKKYIISALCFFWAHSIFAGAPSNVSQILKNNDWAFVQNQGQIKSSKENQNSDIKYYGQQNGVYIYCKPGKLSFVFTKTEKPDDSVSEATGMPVRVQIPEPLRGKQRSSLSTPRSSVATNRADLVLLNSNPNAKILASDRQEYYENYYTTGNADHGITDVHTFKTVTYKDIYNHIDMVLHSRESGLKYEFIVYPGGRVSDIKMKWNGLEGIKKFKDSKIEYSFAFGTMSENKPVSFQGDNIVASDFEKKSNIVGFKLKPYDHGKVLVIDPLLLWGTYCNGARDINSVATDTEGNVFITGITESTSGIGTNGAYQSTYAGDEDAFIVKFNSNGSRLWGTYYGGSGYEYVSGIAIDHAGNSYITGNTSSTTGIATSGTYLTKLNSSSETYVAKFDAKGALKWGTYYGGNYGVGIAVDSSGNVFVTGGAGDTTGVATSGAFLTSLIGKSASYLAAFDTYGSLSWATYFGGASQDQGFAVSADNFGNVYMVGYTYNSTNIATSGAYLSSYGGGSYTYLAKFTAYGKRLWATYYGQYGPTEIYSVATDRFGNVFIGGSTESASGLATTGAYLSSVTFPTDHGFIAKFSPDDSLEWATYYGGNERDLAGQIAIDVLGNVYFTGYTLSTSGIATPGAYQQTLKGSSDGYLAKFNGEGAIQWSTYYGDNQTDALWVATHGSDAVYIAGSTNSPGNVATKGAFESSLTSSSCGFLVKFGIIKNDAGLTAISNRVENQCSDTYFVFVKLKDFGSNTLKKVNISMSVNSKMQSVYKWTGSLVTDSSEVVTLGPYEFQQGYDTIRVWTSEPNGVTDSLPENDTVKAIYHVSSVPDISSVYDTSICAGNPLSLGTRSTVGETYNWTSIPAGFTSTSSDPVIIPDKNAVYILAEYSGSGCAKTDTIHVTVKPSPDAYAGKYQIICSGNTQVNLGTSSVPGDTYDWVSHPAGFNSTISDPLASPSTTTTYILKETNSVGCSKTDSVTIVSGVIPAAATGHDTSICEGNTDTIGADPVRLSKYSWSSLPAGFLSGKANPVISPAATASYILTETNVFGCTKTDTVTITVIPKPVANAGTDATVCQGFRVLLGSKAVAGNTYNWTSSQAGFSSTTAGPIIVADTSAMYYLRVTNKSGCSDSDTVAVVVNPVPLTQVGKSQAICIGSSVVIGGPPVPGNAYIWTSNPTGFNFSKSLDTVAPVTKTTYYLEVDGTDNCSGFDSVTITVTPLPDAHWKDSIICDTVIFNPKTINNQTYTWIFGDGDSDLLNINPHHVYHAKDSFDTKLTTTDSNGCTSVYDSTININCQVTHFDFAFYPNPFHGSATLQYNLPESSKISIGLYDAIGRQISIIRDENQRDGQYSIDVDAEKFHLAKGVYFLVFRSKEKNINIKIVNL